MPLSDTAVRNLKPGPGRRVTKIHDRDGLFLHVSHAGGKSWVLRYRLHGRERSAALGRYPAIGLAQARDKAQEARRLVSAGVDPVTEKRRLRAAAAAQHDSRFSVVCEQWQESKHWTPLVRKQYERMFRVDINPKLGRLPIASIDSAMVQAVVDDVAKRGPVAARHALLLVRGVLSYAVKGRMVPYNVAREASAPVRPKGAKRSYRHLSGTEALREAMTKIQAYGGRPETRIALEMLLHTFVRPSELREARWSEFDLHAIDERGDAAPIWRIPAERTKRAREHWVPLSGRVVELVEAARNLTGDREFLFPHSRREGEAMSRNTFIRALRDYMKLPTTAHGFRHLASTTLNSQGWNGDWVELQLAHWKDDTRGAYNKAKWLPERRRMMEGYSRWLGLVLAGNEDCVVSIGQARRAVKS